MSALKDLIANFLEEMAEFAEPHDRGKRRGEGKLVPVRIRSRDDADALGRWQGDGGRLPRRKGRAGFFDD